jgi:hypothetical protein
MTYKILIYIVSTVSAQQTFTTYTINWLLYCVSANEEMNGRRPLLVPNLEAASGWWSVVLDRTIFLMLCQVQITTNSFNTATFHHMNFSWFIYILLVFSDHKAQMKFRDHFAGRKSFLWWKYSKTKCDTEVSGYSWPSLMLLIKVRLLLLFL